MAMRKLCAKCGCINKFDDSDCTYCGNDISYTDTTDIPREHLQYRFFNQFEGVGTNTPPFDPTQEEALPTPKEVPIEPPCAKEGTLKICPSCGAECDANATECECGRPLSRVRATLPPPQAETAQKPIATPSAPLVIDPELYFEEKPSLYLSFGTSNGIHTNVPVIFEGERFLMGRSHQSFLERCNYVSRTHCFLGRAENGDVYLEEDAGYPSTNGTFIRTSNERRFRIVPGTKYLIRPGTVFYLGDVSVAVQKDQC